MAHNIRLGQPDTLAAYDIAVGGPLPTDGKAAITVGLSSQPNYVRVEDGISTLLLTVGAFHSADNQPLPGAGGAALTAGVAQIVNAGSAAFSGQNADRQRGTTSDGITNIGVATGAQQFGIPITSVGPITSGAITASHTTTVAAASNNNNVTNGTLNVASTTGFAASGTLAVQSTGGIALIAYTGTTSTTFTGCTVTSGSGIVATANSVAETRALTVTNASGTLGNGQAWAISVGQALILDTNNASQEAVTVLAVSGTTVTVCPSKAHNASCTAAIFIYNQARDAGQGDKVSLIGLSPSMAYLYNVNAGSSTQGELERSANGEQDNADGTGTAIAAEYEWNAIAFDRSRNLMGKGLQQSTITSTSGGDASITFSADPSTAANGSLKPGAYLLLSTGLPTPLTGDLVQVSKTYTSGTSVTVNVVGATTTITAGRTKATFSTIAALGPGTTGFIPDGVGIEEECVYNPVDGLYYIERSATQDGVAMANVPSENPCLYNGSTGDRQCANQDLTLLASASRTTTQTSADLVNVNGRCLDVVVDVTVIGTGNITLTINYKDSASGKYILLLAGAAISSNSTNRYRVHPNLTGAANSIAQDQLPRIFQLIVTANNANPVTYSVGYRIGL